MVVNFKYGIRNEFLWKTRHRKSGMPSPLSRRLIFRIGRRRVMKTRCTLRRKRTQRERWKGGSGRRRRRRRSPSTKPVKPLLLRKHITIFSTKTKLKVKAGRHMLEQLVTRRHCMPTQDTEIQSQGTRKNSLRKALLVNKNNSRLRMERCTKFSVEGSKVSRRRSFNHISTESMRTSCQMSKPVSDSAANLLTMMGLKHEIDIMFKQGPSKQ